MINGYVVEVKDRVFDITKGWGTVYAVGEDQSFDVDYGGGSKQHFSTGGFFGTYRRIYWDNPIIIDPPKKASWWEQFVKLVKQIAETFTGMLRRA